MHHIFNGLTSVWYNHLQGINIWILYIHGYPSLRGGPSWKHHPANIFNIFWPGVELNLWKYMLFFFQFYLIVFIHHSIQPKLLRTTKKWKKHIFARNTNEIICIFFTRWAPEPILRNGGGFTGCFFTPLNGLIGGENWTFFDPCSLILKWPKNQWVSTGCFFSHPYNFLWSLIASPTYPLIDFGLPLCNQNWLDFFHWGHLSCLPAKRGHLEICRLLVESKVTKGDLWQCLEGFLWKKLLGCPAGTGCKWM